jgi:hypothetical protein
MSRIDERGVINATTQAHTKNQFEKVKEIIIGVLKTHKQKNDLQAAAAEKENKNWQRILFVSFLFSLHHKA